MCGHREPVWDSVLYTHQDQQARLRSATGPRPCSTLQDPAQVGWCAPPPAAPACPSKPDAFVPTHDDRTHACWLSSVM